MKRASDIFLFLLCFSFLSNAATAETLHGLANIEIRNKKTVLELTQIVTVEDDSAKFVNLDDWGSSSFTVRFEKGKLRFDAADSADGTASVSLKRALSLPLTQDEFLSILHYRRLESRFDVVPNDQSESKTVAVMENGSCLALKPGPEVTWQHKRHKKLKIVFRDFVRINGKDYPQYILITQKKTIFYLQWQKLAFKN